MKNCTVFQTNYFQICCHIYKFCKLINVVALLKQLTLTFNHKLIIQIWFVKTCAEFFVKCMVFKSFLKVKETEDQGQDMVWKLHDVAR